MPQRNLRVYNLGTWDRNSSIPQIGANCTLNSVYEYNSYVAELLHGTWSDEARGYRIASLPPGVRPVSQRRFEMSPCRYDDSRRPAVSSLRVSHLLLLLLLLLRPRQASAVGGTAECAFDGKVSWDGPRTSLKLLPCDESDPHQRWAGATLSGDGRPSIITSVATGECLSTVVNDPVSVVPCSGDGSKWLYNTTNMTIAVSKAASGTLKGKGVGACIDIMGGSGPNVDIWTCHPAGDRDAPNQQLVYNATDQTLRSPHPALAGKCFLLNRTQVNPWVRTPCIWPNQVPAGLPVAQSVALKGISVLENATVIPYYVRLLSYCGVIVLFNSCSSRLYHSESAVATDPLIA